MGFMQGFVLGGLFTVYCGVTAVLYKVDYTQLIVTADIKIDRAQESSAKWHWANDTRRPDRVLAAALWPMNLVLGLGKALEIKKF